jgi:uroporphyrinogen-III synthase
VSVFSVGRATTRAIASHDIAVAGEAETTAGELAALIRRGPVLQLGARAMRDELPRALEERGVIVVRVACYETVPADLANAQQELLASADVVFIGAPSTWGVAQSFVARDAWFVKRTTGSSRAGNRRSWTSCNRWTSSVGEETFEAAQ